MSSAPLRSISRTLVLLLSLSFLVAGCGGDDASSPTSPSEPEPQLDRIEVSPDSAELNAEGDTAHFEATAFDEDGNEMSGVDFAWSSSDTTVAGVDSDGVATARGEGTVDIEASAENVTGASQLAVELPSTRIVSPNDNGEVEEGETVTFEAEAENPDGSSVPDDQIEWKSNIDGDLGTGSTVSVDGLSAETHWIKLAATLSNEDVRRDSITLLVKMSPDSMTRQPTDEDESAGHMIGQVLIRYTDATVTNEVIAEVNRQFDIKTQRKVSGLSIYLAKVETNADSTRKLADRIGSHDAVQSATVNSLMPPSGQSVSGDITEDPKQRQHVLTATTRLWESLQDEGVSLPGQKPSGERVDIAIVDGGFDLDHSDFSPSWKFDERVADMGIFTGANRDRDKVDDDDQHGTGVASIAAGSNSDGDGLSGIAPGATIIPIRAGPVVEIAIGVEYAVGVGADVINISRSPSIQGLVDDDEQFLDASGLKEAMRMAADSGVAVVTSAGNSGNDLSRTNLIGRSNNLNVIVGGTNFSGDDIFTDSQTGPALDVLAPAVSTSAAQAGTASDSTEFEATSAAAPVVAGLIAAYVSAGESPLDAADRVLREALDLAADGNGLSSDGRDDRTGHGRVIGGVELQDLNPESVPEGEVTTVRARGRNFSADATVLVNGEPVTPNEVRSHQELTFDVRPESGTDVLSVSVENPSGLSTRRDTIEVNTETLAYVSNRGSGSVSVIDLSSNMTTTTIPVRDDPEAAATTPDGKTVLISHLDPDHISVIDVASKSVTDTVPVGDRPTAIAVRPDGSTAYVANANSDDVSVIDLSSNTVVTAIDVGDNPQGVAVTPDGGTVYVANERSDNVSVIDVTSNSVTSTIDVGGAPRAIALTPDGSTAFVANSDSDNVAVIDAALNSVVTTIPAGVIPHSIIVTPQGGKAYLANQGSNDVSVIDVASNSVVTTVDVGVDPSAIAVTPDGDEVYVANSRSDDISVVDVSADSVTATVGVVDGPQGIAIAP